MSSTNIPQKSAILLIAHGSSELSAVSSFSDLFYAELKEKFPDWKVYQAYSAPKTLKRIDREKAQTPVNTVPEVMEQIQEDGVSDLRVFAVNLNPCKKHSRVLDMIEPYRKAFSSVKVSAPLLNPGADPALFVKVLSGIIDGAIADISSGEPDLIVLAAHTANEEILSLWQPVLDRLRALCFRPVRLVFHKGKPDWADLLAELSGEDGRRYVLIVPMLLFGGRHLQKDLTAAEGSLSAALRKAGHDAVVSPHGLGEYAKIRDLFYQSIGEH